MFDLYNKGDEIIYHKGNKQYKIYDNKKEKGLKEGEWVSTSFFEYVEWLEKNGFKLDYQTNKGIIKVMNKNYNLD